MLSESPVIDAEHLLAAERWQEAKLLSEWIAANPQLASQAEQAQGIARQASAALDSLPQQARDVLEGAISGEPKNGAGFVGALALDLFVIGDIRDLIVQGWKEVRHDDGDAVILALSAVGLTLSLAPELHWAPSLLKGLKRTGALTQSFSKQLQRIARQAIKTRNFKPLATVVSEFSTVIKKLGMGPMKGAMKSVETEQQLTKLAAAAKSNPKHSYAVARLGGTRGLKALNKTASNLPQVANKIRLASKASKISLKAFGALPTQALIASMIIALGVVFRRVLLRLITKTTLLATRSD